MNLFKISKKAAGQEARTGLLATPHGLIHTPAFLPIGSRGSVKAVSTQELKFWGTEIILANTYHLWMRPGDLLVRKSGGLHRFMGWDGPILSDSGGFQVFSLGEKRGKILEINEGGVRFQSDVDGQTHLLTPEESINIQANLGSDIALVLDFFPGYPFTEKRLQKAVDLTLLWAERSLRHYQKIKAQLINPGQMLFGIVQGGDAPGLRKKCAQGLRELDFPGYGIGGVAVGEPEEVMYRAVEATVPYLEEEKPRHLLGVGTPQQLLGAVARGCDMFDCVLPTRNARHGELFVSLKPPREGYTTLKITNQQYKEDFTPPDNTCDCYLCTHHTRAYLRHLFQSGEPLAVRLATIHNLRFYLNLMEKIRRAIEYSSFAELVQIYEQA